jgi:tetratricopeptide (TPR) repeat protein
VESDSAEGSNAANSAPSRLPGLSEPDRAQLLAGLARAFEKLERYDQSVSTYQQAIRLEKTAATKAELRKSLNAVRAILNRRKLNLARQPLVRPELEQVNVVRPRLQVPQNLSPPRTIPAKAKPLSSTQTTRRTQ